MSDAIYYILTSEHEIKTVSFLEWSEWFEPAANRRISSTFYGNIHVSTVFLPTDHNFGFDAAGPILFETMIFREFETLYDYQTRCRTYAEALKMHDAACAYVLSHMEDSTGCGTHAEPLDDEDVRT